MAHINVVSRAASRLTAKNLNRPASIYSPPMALDLHHKVVLHPYLNELERLLSPADQWLVFGRTVMAYLPRDIADLVSAYWRPCVCVYSDDSLEYTHWFCCKYKRDGGYCTWCDQKCINGEGLHATSCPYWLPVPCSNRMRCMKHEHHVCFVSDGLPIHVIAPKN